MAMTFDDFYQSVPEESEPLLTKTNKPSVLEPKPTNTDKLSPSPGADDFQLDEFRCLFSTPFACGFHREVDIDRAGGYISYIAPDGITRLESRTAMERYLKQHLTLDLPTLNFCWENLILGFDDPEWETICTPDQGYSQTQSRSPIASLLNWALEN